MQSQTILVIYQTESFVVDYTKLYNSSNKFRELIQPYIDNGQDTQNLQLRILYDKFSPRNVRNFLKMIQNIKNDVHSNEIAEICEIAKLFQVENLYNKSLTFVRSRIDPNFVVLNDFDETYGQKYLEIEYATEQLQPPTYLSSNPSFDSTLGSVDLNSNNSYNNIPQTQEITPPPPPPSEPAPKQELHNACYKIQILSPLMKCSRYIFSQEGRILFTAKKKSNEIYIGKGNDVHINTGDGNGTCARIMQCNGYNNVYTNEQDFKVTFIPFGPKNHFSIEVSFVHQGMTASWIPRQNDAFLQGEYHHVPIESKKNILLQNQSGTPTFAVRKMGNDMFEVECLSTVNPLTAFTIGLSQIIGPYC